MYTEEVAARLVEMWQRGDFGAAALPTAEAVSDKTYAIPAFEGKTKGPDTMPEKGKQRHGKIAEYAA